MPFSGIGARLSFWDLAIVSSVLTLRRQVRVKTTNTLPSFCLLQSVLSTFRSVAWHPRRPILPDLLALLEGALLSLLEFRLHSWVPLHGASFHAARFVFLHGCRFLQCHSFFSCRVYYGGDSIHAVFEADTCASQLGKTSDECCLLSL